MKRIDTMTILGIVIGLALVVVGISTQGTLKAFWDPSGLMITLGGSFGALLVSFRFEDIKVVFRVTKQAFVRQDEDITVINERFVNLARKARKEGLLYLETELDNIQDPFTRNGLQMVIDGFEPDMIRHILNTEIDAMEARHELGQNLYRTWGMLTPAFGMLGTLIGLVMMLAYMDDSTKIGPGMAIALLTTFYGVLMAYLIFIPLANKLSIYSAQEVRRKEMIVDALLALQQGINPRLLQEQLKVYLAPAEREALEESSEYSGKVKEVTVDV